MNSAAKSNDLIEVHPHVDKPAPRDIQQALTFCAPAWPRIDFSKVGLDYSERHGVNAAGVLTMYRDEAAELVAQYLAPRIEGRTIVEIGGGVGLLAFHLGQYAKRVYCIEANPT
jgi:hypothetical protein